MKKIFIITLLSLFMSFNAQAGSDENKTLSKENSKSTKDCFEGVNRAYLL